jgi:hypothetical protein
MMYISVLASNGTDVWRNNLQSCRETWCKTLDPEDELHFIFGKCKPDSYFGDSLIHPDHVYAFKQVLGEVIQDEVHYPVPDGYVSLATYKTLLSIRDFLETGHQFFVRTHTGSYLHLGLLRDVCRKMSSTNLYAGDVLVDNNRGITYAAGSCFVISRDVAELVMNVCSDFLQELCNDPMKGTWSALMDDALFGKIICGKHGIPVTPLSKICVNDSVDFNPKMAHYYMTGKSGKQSKYYHMIHEKFQNYFAKGWLPNV